MEKVRSIFESSSFLSLFQFLNLLAQSLNGFKPESHSICIFAQSLINYKGLG